MGAPTTRNCVSSDVQLALRSLAGGPPHVLADGAEKSKPPISLPLSRVFRIRAYGFMVAGSWRATGEPHCSASAGASALRRPQSRECGPATVRPVAEVGPPLGCVSFSRGFRRFEDV